MSREQPTILSGTSLIREVDTTLSPGVTTDHSLPSAPQPDAFKFNLSGTSNDNDSWRTQSSMLSVAQGMSDVYRDRTSHTSRSGSRTKAPSTSRSVLSAMTVSSTLSDRGNSNPAVPISVTGSRSVPKGVPPMPASSHLAPVVVSDTDSESILDGNIMSCLFSAEPSQRYRSATQADLGHLMSVSMMPSTSATLGDMSQAMGLFHRPQRESCLSSIAPSTGSKSLGDLFDQILDEEDTDSERNRARLTAQAESSATVLAAAKALASRSLTGSKGRGVDRGGVPSPIPEDDAKSCMCSTQAGSPKGTHHAERTCSFDTSAAKSSSTTLGTSGSGEFCVMGSGTHTFRGSSTSDLSGGSSQTPSPSSSDCLGPAVSPLCPFVGLERERRSGSESDVEEFCISPSTGSVSELMQLGCKRTQSHRTGRDTEGDDRMCVSDTEHDAGHPERLVPHKDEDVWSRSVSNGYSHSRTSQLSRLSIHYAGPTDSAMSSSTQDTIHDHSVLFRRRESESTGSRAWSRAVSTELADRERVRLGVHPLVPRPSPDLAYHELSQDSVLSLTDDDTIYEDERDRERERERRASLSRGSEDTGRNVPRIPIRRGRRLSMSSDRDTPRLTDREGQTAPGESLPVKGRVDVVSEPKGPRHHHMRPDPPVIQDIEVLTNHFMAGSRRYSLLKESFKQRRVAGFRIVAIAIGFIRLLFSNLLRDTSPALLSTWLRLSLTGTEVPESRMRALGAVVCYAAMVLVIGLGYHGVHGYDFFQGAEDYFHGIMSQFGYYPIMAVLLVVILWGELGVKHHDRGAREDRGERQEYHFKHLRLAGLSVVAPVLGITSQLAIGAVVTANYAQATGGYANTNIEWYTSLPLMALFAFGAFAYKLAAPSQILRGRILFYEVASLVTIPPVVTGVFLWIHSEASVRETVIVWMHVLCTCVGLGLMLLCLYMQHSMMYSRHDTVLLRSLLHVNQARKTLSRVISPSALDPFFLYLFRSLSTKRDMVLSVLDVILDDRAGPAIAKDRGSGSRRPSRNASLSAQGALRRLSMGKTGSNTPSSPLTPLSPLSTLNPSSPLPPRAPLSGATPPLSPLTTSLSLKGQPVEGVPRASRRGPSSLVPSVGRPDLGAGATVQGEDEDPLCLPLVVSLYEDALHAQRQPRPPTPVKPSERNLEGVQRSKLRDWILTWFPGCDPLLGEDLGDRESRGDAASGVSSPSMALRVVGMDSTSNLDHALLGFNRHGPSSLEGTQGEREAEAEAEPGQSAMDAFLADLDNIESHVSSVITPFPLAVCLFCDIVNFTVLSQTVTSDVLVGTLTGLFQAFDDALLQYPLARKVKTVGDAYEAMTPFSAPALRSLHESDLVQAALDMVRLGMQMRDAVRRISSEMGHDLSVRIGIGVGPAFGAILSTSRISYDVFGLGPAVARSLEGIAPKGEVVVSSTVQRVLAAVPGVQFGCPVHHSSKEDQLQQELARVADGLLRRMYRPLETDSKQSVYEEQVSRDQSLFDVPPRKSDDAEGPAVTPLNMHVFSSNTSGVVVSALPPK
ncbi:hypothetical protein KIPB_002437 [Kipferlia bialata]|uniref:adenylate cyclase n=1 Tax=Kipferlia bialata TaxID=797122 RepID=A0A9K3GGM8_9EUKA|nr:hypothetical protein KIPB_002437 [Kipferlia bialata]|eukprot:g2437.t1